MSDPTKGPAQKLPRSAHGVSYEPSDLTARPIMQTVVILFVMIFGVYVVCLIAIKLLTPPSKSQTGAISGLHELPPEPRLEVEGPAILRDLRQEEDTLLNHYAWVDPANGVVRIPIARAMELLVQRGLPSRSEKAGQ